MVKAHLEDELGSMAPGNLSVGLDSEMDNPLDTTAADEFTTNSDTTAAPQVWVYVVDEMATLGDHEITVESTAPDVDDVVLTVAVAGSPHSYTVNGPDTIPLGGSADFTVVAVDEADGVPNVTDDNKMVDIVLQGLASGNVRGLTDDMIELDENGMDTFTIYAPNNAEDGHLVRIFIAGSEMEMTTSSPSAPRLPPAICWAPLAA